MKLIVVIVLEVGESGERLKVVTTTEMTVVLRSSGGSLKLMIIGKW